MSVNGSDVLICIAYVLQVNVRGVYREAILAALFSYLGNRKT